MIMMEEGTRLGWEAERILAACLKGARRIDRTWGKRRALERRQRREILQSWVTRAQLALERHPESGSLQHELAEARETLQALDVGLASWMDKVMQARWISEGDKCSKVFFKSFKSLASSKSIPALLNEVGETVSSWEEMAETITTFFRNSFGGIGERPPMETTAAHQERILELLSDKLTDKEKLRLNEPLSLLELELAAREMKNLKCPGPDGAPVEFYKAMWPTVRPLLLKALSSGIDRKEFREELSLGLIVLLPKKNDQRVLNNKRPITLLNVSYKIGAKAMQMRLTPILQRLISPQQFAFLPGRNIHHSLVLLGEMLNQARSTSC